MSSRANTFFSLGVMPAFMGVGHLAPAVGAIHTAAGEYQFPAALLILIGVISGLVDSVDTYKDVPLDERPRKWVWRAWTWGGWSIVAICTYLVGFQTALLIYRPLPLGLLWGAPCIPMLMKGKGLSFSKPKTLLCEVKSLVVAVCMASVTAEASTEYACTHLTPTCLPLHASARRSSFYLAILYHFFRETSCDIRDIDEDTKEGLETLPVRLGKQNTILLMAMLGLLVDSVLTEGVMLVPGLGMTVVVERLLGSFARVMGTMMVYSVILRFPRQNYWAWGGMSLFGLTPVLFAQRALRS